MQETVATMMTSRRSMRAAVADSLILSISSFMLESFSM